KFAQSYNPTGEYGDVAYRNKREKFNYLGYGLAVSRFLLRDNLQLKASFEKSYRMPEKEELFGDLINLSGNIDLAPEHSLNYNMGASYWLHFRSERQLHFSANVFYRDARAFIRSRQDRNQAMQIMDNLGKVTNKGIEGEIRYRGRKHFNLGMNLTYQDLRNNTRYEDGQTVVSAVYKDRIPNMPFLYGNADAQYTFYDVLGK